MSKIALSGNASGTGVFTFASPNSNTDRTLTLPDNTGTIITTASTFAGTGPAFSAYLSGSQSISTGTPTKVALNTETFDTANCFDNTTNYRFTPNVAGYYQVNAMIAANGSSITAIVTDIRKNGSTYRVNVLQASVSPTTCLSLSDLIYMNGSTDYLELYGQVNATSPNFGGTSVYTFMSAYLARSA